MKLLVSVVGVGQMGLNHARVVAESVLCDLHWICDVDLNRANEVAARFGVRGTNNFDRILESDAVVIATPTEFHFSLAQRAIEAGVPLLIEKPLSTNLGEVRELAELSRQHNVSLQCGFVERFNPVIATALGVLEESIRHISVMRHSPTTPRATTSVIEDLMIHDIDLLTSFCPTGFNVVGVAAHGGRFSRFPETAEALLSSSDGAIASLSASRNGQRKIRTWMITTENQLLELDLLRQTIIQYRHVEEAVGPGGAPAYREKTIIDYPFIRRSREPLAAQFEHFLKVVMSDGPCTEDLERILTAHRLMNEIATSVH